MQLSHNLRDLKENISWIRIGLTVTYPFLCPRRQFYKKISNCKYCAIMKLLPNDIYEINWIMRYFAINKNCDGNSFYHFIVPYFLIGIRHFDNPWLKPSQRDISYHCQRLLCALNLFIELRESVEDRSHSDVCLFLNAFSRLVGNKDWKLELLLD